MAYIKQLTFLRFLAAILVVIFHFGKEELPFNLYPISSIVNEGSIAVSFFFFLSGVVLAINYLKIDNLSSKSFYKKRFARIYPVYLLAFVSTLLLGMIYYDAFPKVGSIILQLLSLHAWLPGICLEINFPAWSISVEVFFYLLFPIILVLFRKINNLKITIITLTVWILSIFIHYYLKENLYSPDERWTSEFILYFPLWHLNTFLFGILCGIYILKEQKLERHSYSKARFFYILGIISFLLILGTDNFIRPYTHNGLMSPVFFLIIAGLALDRSLLTKILGSKYLVVLGNASYSIYILQWPVYIIFSAFLSSEKLEGNDFYFYLFSLIFISVFIYTYFEKPMQKAIINKWIVKQ